MPPFIPPYFAKWIEEGVRSVAFAVGTFVVMSIQTEGLPSGKQAIVALFTAAIPIAYAAFRQFLNNTPLTPPTGPAGPPSEASNP